MIAELLATLFAFGPQAAAAGQQELAVEQVIAKLQADLEAFEAALPDFMCEEKVTSQSLRGEKMRSQAVNESHFGARRNSSPGAPVSFAEVRATHTVNSKRVPAGRKLKGPVIFTNFFVNLLHGAVGPDWARLYDFKIAGRETIGSQAALVIAYTARGDQQRTGITINKRFTHSRTTGKIWVDANSMHVLRLTCSYPDLPQSFDIAMSIDYSPVDIGGRPFWMPKTVRAESSEKKPKKPADRKSSIFIAEYSEYKKFEVNSTITYNEP